VNAAESGIGGSARAKAKPPLYFALAGHGNPSSANGHAVPRNGVVSNSLLNLTLNLVAIVVCGALGAGAGYGVVALAGVGGVMGALVAASVGMAVATAAWAAGVAALRAAGRLR